MSSEVMVMAVGLRRSIVVAAVAVVGQVGGKVFSFLSFEVV